MRQAGARPMDDTLCAALRYLGIRNGDEAVYAELSALKASLAERITPRSVWRACQLTEPPALDVRAFALGGKMLADCTQAVVLVCTLGAAFDLEVRRLSARDMRRAALLDALGSAWVESACDAAEDEIRARFPGMHLTDRFSPGYGDLPLTLQPALADFAGARRIGVTLTDTLLLNPQKSVTAILGVAEAPQPAHVRGCAYCALHAACPYRKNGSICHV